jgi:prolyl oligopeptidase
MKNILILALTILSALSVSSQDLSIKYPSAPTSASTDILWDYPILDPHRPLESTNDATTEWLRQEKKITENYFKNHEKSADIGFDIKTANNFIYNIPTRSGPYYIEYFRNELRECIDVYYKKELKDNRTFLASPFHMKNLVTRFSQVKISADGKYCALMYSAGGGSEWQEISIIDMRSMWMTKDHIQNVRYSDITWCGGGFFYSRFDGADAATGDIATLTNQKIYYHTVGQEPSLDSLVFDDIHNRKNTFKVTVTEDERFVVINETDYDADKSITYFKDRTKGGSFRLLLDEPSSSAEVIGSIGDTLIAVQQSPRAFNRQIVAIDTRDTSHKTILINNQRGFRIKQAAFIQNKILVIYQNGFKESLCAFSRSGEMSKSIALPYGSNNEMICYASDQNGIVMVENYYICPPIGNILSLKDLTLSLIDKTVTNFNPDNYNINITHYPSRDSIMIPVYTVSAKKTPKHGPALLRISGGIDNSYSPSFDPGIITFVNNGGTFAFANIRGTNNAVKNWHQSGIGVNKQNSIDDAYGAIRFLRDSLAVNKIGLIGTDFGALIAAALINQHPETVQAAVLNSGIYDPMRFEKFTVGAYYKKELGSIGDSSQFRKMLSYSPLQNIKSGIEYPSILVSTAEFDGLIPPFQSYKYVASLQESVKSAKPLLLLVNQNQGHSSGSFEQRIRSEGLTYSFLFKELSMEFHQATTY